MTTSSVSHFRLIVSYLRQMRREGNPRSVYNRVLGEEIAWLESVIACEEARTKEPA